ncbi:uncharacterized protein LOC124115314 isoform X2 [Haliotis rufescens]|uniref:uncharacterized protein LOC124115314 isoform X2 n=1 Tax=Haliotis rufescens TaxID=6454 RepID=UPI00201F51AE|nr:uncharacterized protein LOC124115314 isoform X2 [Haliotis rufescens]
MDGSSYHASVISFKTSETSPAVLKLDIKWGDMSRVLVAVTNQLGYLERILFLERCESHNFVWSGFTNSQLYTVLVWGLKDSPATGAVTDLKDNPATGAIIDLKDNPATCAIIDLKDNQATGAIIDLKDNPATCAIIDLKDNPATCAIIDLKDNPATGAVIDLKDNPATCAIIDLKDNPATSAVIDLKDNPATGAVTDLKDNPATCAIIDLKDNPATCAVIDLKDNPATGAVIDLKDSPATCAIIDLKDNPATGAVIDLKDSPATCAIIDLKDNPATGAITDLKDNPATGAVTDPMVASYTVEAFERISIPQSGEPEERVRVLDLAGGNHFGFLTMKDLLKSQEVLEMEVEHKPPLDYSLKPTGPSDSEAGLCVVFCERSQKEYVVMSSAPVSAGIPLLPVCRSRTNYKVRAIGLTNNKGHTFRQLSPVCQQNTPCGSSNIIPIKTYMSKEDLAKLQEKAETYCRNHALTPKKYPITQMYRNKPISYFNGIMYNKNGVMEKYLKDNNGDPYSAINNKISGLFFSGSFDTRETNPPQRPPNFSYFGEIRLFVPAEELFTSDIRMYFADFFCHYKVHYVTVVLTKTGSDDDKFCEERLIELDLQTNPFFTVTENVPHRRNEMPVSPNSDENSVSRDDSHPASEEPSSTETPMARPASPSYTIQEVVQKTFTMTSVNKFHVEFLYTEDVDIKGLTEKCGGDKVYRRTVLVRGNGRSLPEGIPKKASCGTCNLCY